MRKIVAAAALYAGASLLLFGREVLLDPVHRVVGDDGADKTLYMWSLVWWPESLRRGHNPLDVDVAWAPHGFDLGLGTAGGGLALVAAPLTAGLGPVATYNLLVLAAPALAATSAFLLAHLVTQRLAPSLVAGWVFGFSTYETGRILGHLPLAFVALVPLVPYLILRRHGGSLSGRAFVALLAAVLVGQFLIVTQVFFSLLLVVSVAAALSLAVFGARRVGRTIAETALAVAVTLVAVSPVVLYALSSAAAPARSPFWESTDLLEHVVPGRRTWIRPPGAEEVAARFSATGAEQGAYLGLPFLVLVVLAGAVGFRRPRDRRRLFTVCLLAAVVLLSLGTRIKVAGTVVGIGPWEALARLPVIESALPARLTLYTSLLAGLLVAFALSDRPSRARWLLAAGGIALTLPNVQLDRWSSDVPRPAFFQDGLDRCQLQPGATVLVLPYGPAGWSMLWHAESRFRFRLVGGHFALRVTPEEERWRDVYEGLGAGRVATGRFRSFLDEHDVAAVVVAPGTRPGAARLVAEAIRRPPTRTADVKLYRPSRGR